MANALMPIPILNNYKTILYHEVKTSNYAYCYITLPEDINHTLAITDNNTNSKKILLFIEYKDAITGELLKLEKIPVTFVARR
jgi:hypothetical protein